MMNLSRKGLFLLVQTNIDMLMVATLSIAVAFFLPRLWRRKRSVHKQEIPGQLGFPVIGETISFLSAANSTKGCYDFVSLRRLRHGNWFKTRIFGKIHVFVPSTEGARTVFTNDFINFNKGYVKSMADAVGRKSLLCVPHESHKRIRRLLSDPFSMQSLHKFVKEFDTMLCRSLKEFEQAGKSFVVLDFMQMTFAAMCAMLMSVRDELLLRQIEKDCSAFGSGPRTCLGMNMAKVTLLVFPSFCIYRWTVEDQDASLEKKAHIPRLRSGCPITLMALNRE